MRELESAQAKLVLYLTAIGDTKSLRKYGRIGCKFDEIEALMRCSLERGMITQEDYEEVIAVDEEND